VEYTGTYRNKYNIPRNSQKNIKKNGLKPWRSREWRIPPEGEPGFVAAMEDILDVYTGKYDENCILICMDEAPRQLIGETRKPVPVERGKIAHYDTEYKRNGAPLKAGEGRK
jgi:hypothetical protein